LLTGSITFFTWMADTERITQTPQKGGGGGGDSVARERSPRVRQDKPPSENAQSSATPEETVGATVSSAIEGRGGAKAPADASPASQAGCMAGEATEATTGLFVTASRVVECADPAAPPSVAPSPDKALPQAGGADVTSLLALATGSLLVCGGLLALRFTR
jgi:hypothetical protein